MLASVTLRGSPDARVARLAARQHAVVSAAQLRAEGLTRDAVRHRVRHGRLTPLHRGVYRVGPMEAPLTRFMAAVLACGPGAVLSHRAAAFVHGFAPEPRDPVDVTVAAGQPRSRPGIRVHRSQLTPNETDTASGIPATTPARTLSDLAATASPRELSRAVEEAQVQRRLDRRSLAEAVDHAAGRRGARALRAAANRSEPSLTRSEAERRAIELVERANLPRPQSNARIGRYEVDLLWPRQRLVAEIDGFAFHGSREAFERDRARDADLTARGYRVLRLTWRQLADEPEAVAARLAAALAVSPGARAPA